MSRTWPKFLLRLRPQIGYLAYVHIFTLMYVCIHTSCPSVHKYSHGTYAWYLGDAMACDTKPHSHLTADNLSSSKSIGIWGRGAYRLGASLIWRLEGSCHRRKSITRQWITRHRCLSTWPRSFQKGKPVCLSTCNLDKRSPLVANLDRFRPLLGT